MTIPPINFAPPRILPDCASPANASRTWKPLTFSQGRPSGPPKTNSVEAGLQPGQQAQRALFASWFCSGEFISPLLAPEARHTLAPPRKGGEPNHSKIASAFGVGATQNSAALSQTPRTLPPRGRDARKCRPPAELGKSLRARQISTPAYFCPSAQL